MAQEIKVEHKDQLKLLVAEIKKDTNSYAFHQPVPWEAMGLLNYPIIIKKPMDLQSIKQSIQNDKYKTYDAVFSDIQLIWSNCKQYNQQGSPIYTQAEKMERKSKKLIKELKAKIFNTSKSKVNKSKGKPVSKIEDVKVKFDGKVVVSNSD